MIAQRRRRRVEQEVRADVLAFARLGRRWGRPDADCARYLGLCMPTLRRWRRQWRADHLVPRRRGRPPQRGDPVERREVIHVLTCIAARTGLPTLQRAFPQVPRAELIELQQRCRRVVHHRRHETVHVLRWTRPGAVWAIDFTQPPCPIDGCFPRITAARDLAAQFQLLVLPGYDERTEPTLRILDMLVEQHGAPLALKLDNGPAFIDHRLKDWAARHRVMLLYSPPRMPEYNGAAEAGIGAVVTRTFHHAARNGRQTHWTCDDLFAARCEANDTARPWGRETDTPSQRWRSRIPISDIDRERFMDCCRRHQRNERVVSCSPVTLTA
jgi:transposase-like protein